MSKYRYEKFQSLSHRIFCNYLASLFFFFFSPQSNPLLSLSCSSALFYTDPSLVVLLFVILLLCSLQLVMPFGNGSYEDLWVGVNWSWTTKEMFQSCGQKSNFRESERERRAYFLWVWWILTEEFVFLMEEVVSLWMEGGLCHGTEEEVLGRKVYRVLEKLYFDFLFFL